SVCCATTISITGCAPGRSGGYPIDVARCSPPDASPVPPMDTPPTDDAGLLDRLRAGDPLAPSQFCERFLPVLLGNRGWAAGLTRDGHAVEQAAHDALLAFVRRPHVYDPSRL